VCGVLPVWLTALPLLVGIKKRRKLKMSLGKNVAKASLIKRLRKNKGQRPQKRRQKTLKKAVQHYQFFLINFKMPLKCDGRQQKYSHYSSSFAASRDAQSERPNNLVYEYIFFFFLIANKILKINLNVFSYSRS